MIFNLHCRNHDYLSVFVMFYALIKICSETINKKLNKYDDDISLLLKLLILFIKAHASC